MLEYIDQNRDSFIKIQRDHNIDKDIIHNAHILVKKFIIENDLIIFGGLAIDYGLRLKGSSIYSDNELPDYDCLSDKSVDYAYNMGEILFNSGFENVKVIRAMHPTTMRVRVNLITVMDISYCPKKYYQKYKYLIYDQMKIAHPEAQRIYFHYAFCYPMGNAPLENIFNRWKKDIYRFNLVNEHYPMSSNYDISFINSKCKLKTFTLPVDMSDQEYAFHGFAAYALLYQSIQRYKQLNVPKLHISIDKDQCSLELPIDGNLEIVTSSINKVEITNYTILEIIPEAYIHKDVTIYYTDLLSISQCQKYQIGSVHFLLVYFIFHYLFSDNNEHKEIYKTFYISILQMLVIAEQLIIDNDYKLPEFMPSIDYLGKKIEYINIIEKNMNTSNWPINYHPHKIGTRTNFDYNKFKIGGESVEDN
jgi:hypothetical protein